MGVWVFGSFGTGVLERWKLSVGGWLWSLVFGSSFVLLGV
jgi:hypothetical protein